MELSVKLIASLPWYDHPVSSSALDSIWTKLRSELVRHGLVGAPFALNRSMSLQDQWRHPGLVLSQCCGPDLFTDAAANVDCLGRPVFQDLDCPPGYYYSHIVGRGEPHPNPAVAINSPTSWSGNTALGQWLRERGLECARCVISNSHQESLNLLRQGEVDLIAIDAHTWSLLDGEGVELIGRSALAMTPPFISGIRNVQTNRIIREALIKTLASYGHRIGIAGVLDASKELYSPVDSENGIELNDWEGSAGAVYK